MDEDNRQIIEKIKEKYRNSDNPDIESLLSIINSLELKLISADVMAMMVDLSVKRDTLRTSLDSRSGIADARLNYGTPWKYEFADKELLLGYRGGIEEVKDRLKP